MSGRRRRHRETLLVITVVVVVQLLCGLVLEVNSQQLTRPVIIASNPPNQQHYASGLIPAKPTSPRPPPPPPPPTPSQAQLQQQYIAQQKQQQYRQQQQQAQQQPQIVYQKPQAQIQPQRTNQLRERGPPANQQQQQQNQNEASYEYDDEDPAEPDRLTQLLISSKFQCSSKKDGYYADESLNCEVFHYCHDNVKHSWMCPNQFVFHQVHLICVPPSTENICKQSSQFHFVNEYLYRPVNAKEAASDSKINLRYADRYYPEGYAHGDPLNEQYLLEEASQRNIVTAASPSTKPSSSLAGKKQQQVYFSADSVNIPLSQRRPSIAPPQASRQQQQQQSGSLSDEYDYE